MGWSKQQEALVSTWTQIKHLIFNIIREVHIISVISTENDVNIRLVKEWTNIDRLSIKVWSIQLNKTGFIPRCGRCQFYCMDAPHGHKQNARENLDANYIRILEAAHHEITAVQPLTSHFKTHPSKTNIHGRSKKNLFTSALCGHGVQFGRPARNDGW